MSRISLAVALMSAIVAAGCGGSGTSSGSGEGRGVQDGTFTLTVQNGQAGPALQITGGKVYTDDLTIECGAGVAAQRCSAAFPLGTTVVLKASPAAPNLFLGWAGDCSGEGDCTLAGNADKYVVASFGAERTGHPNWTDGLVHGPKAADWLANAPGALDCRTCHGPSLQGQGLAPSCSSCHAGRPHVQVASATMTTGPAVTAACIKCHEAEADQLLGSNHFTWLGSSNLVGKTTPSSIGKRNVINNFCVATASNEARCMQCHPSYSSAPVKDPATGAIAPNTGPMYLWTANAAVDKGRIDCLVCHASLGTSRYVKGPAGFGQPWVANDGACFPSCAANQICSTKDSAGNPWSDGKAYCRAPVAATEIVPALQAAANSVGATQRANCGFCHFTAGGGDNVKMGDLGSALTSPTADVDVHMGSQASYAPRRCADCHESGSHTLRGTGLSIPVDDEGRLTCTDCHSGIHAPAHSDPAYTAHADFIACQTCHIPTFSRTQYTKVNWDWQTAADKQACQGVAGCVGFGSLTYPAGNAQSGAIAGVGGEAPKGHDPVTQGYDWKKGVSTYATNVTPTYRWIAPASAQQGTHETTARDGLLGSGTVDDPFRLADLLPPPAPVLAGWKIAPFKRMTGRSPAFADASAMIVPHVFGSDSLWQNDLRGYPVVANTLGSAGNPWTQAKADAIWTGVNNYGAAVGGQLGQPVAKAAGGQMTRDASGLVTVNTIADLPATLPATLYLVGAEAAFPSGVKAVTKTGPRQLTYPETIPYTANPGASPPITLPALPATSTAFVAFYPELAATDWRWAYTVMYINLNHEVAPVTTALTCSSCHPSLGGSVDTSRMKDLYGLQAGGCTDPMDCKKR
ncbi:hypothetical protein [Anaeromyxobacter oryzae]|uniref:Cytochrome c family protein n=1 Tax=Anaeromyxobacter oryzae TaxID=2918170 RepID=A0ABN6MXC6_9BACT|nr:hypothetical protein [Anaeromyxobacter oryzae]BDG05236.1 hypothetical protein AMOR_42320 [Anaeromyxobacter oryzae]